MQSANRVQNVLTFPVDQAVNVLCRLVVKELKGAMFATSIEAEVFRTETTCCKICGISRILIKLCTLNV